MPTISNKHLKPVLRRNKQFVTSRYKRNNMGLKKFLGGKEEPIIFKKDSSRIMGSTSERLLCQYDDFLSDNWTKFIKLNWRWEAENKGSRNGGHVKTEIWRLISLLRRRIAELFFYCHKIERHVAINKVGTSFNKRKSNFSTR